MPRVKPYLSLSYAERTQRRQEAVRLLNAGVPGSIVAQTVGVTKSGISRWKRVLQIDGPSAIEAARQPGRKPSLSDAQVRVLITLLAKPPSAYGLALRHDRWTWEAVTLFAADQLGVKCARPTVQRLLRRKQWAV